MTPIHAAATAAVYVLLASALCGFAQAVSTSALLELGHCPAGNTTSALPGSGHFCAISAAGQIACAGANLTAQALVPATLSAPTANALFVCTGLRHSCAVSQSGPNTAVSCWGDNAAGQCTPAGGLTNAASIACGGAHTCATLTTKAVVCWGSDVVSVARACSDWGLQPFK
jgi:alpha-tubulin suppressor-like RCC1 family protein